MWVMFITHKCLWQNVSRFRGLYSFAEFRPRLPSCGTLGAAAQPICLPAPGCGPCATPQGGGDSEFKLCWPLATCVTLDKTQNFANSVS